MRGGWWRNCARRHIVAALSPLTQREQQQLPCIIDDSQQNVEGVSSASAIRVIAKVIRACSRETCAICAPARSGHASALIVTEDKTFHLIKYG